MSQNKYSLAPLILAAGSSSRLGQPKQLLRLKGDTLIENAIHNAFSINANCSVVLGANHRLIQKQISSLKVDAFLHENWQEGIGSSIAFGMKNLLEKQPDLENVLILLCDQPFITSSLLLELQMEHYKKNQAITACKYGEAFGVPAIFNQTHFSELRSLEGDKGAKKVISKHLNKTNFIDFPMGKIDIDEVRDLKYLD